MLFQKGTLDLYNEIKGGKGSYVITGLVNTGSLVASYHIAKVLYSTFHTTKKRSGFQYIPSSRNQLQYRNTVRAARASALSPTRSTAMRKRAKQVVLDGEHFTLNLQKILVGMSALKVSYGTLSHYKRSGNILESLAYGLFIPVSVIREDSRNTVS